MGQEGWEGGHNSDGFYYIKIKILCSTRTRGETALNLGHVVYFPLLELETNSLAIFDFNISSQNIIVLGKQFENSYKCIRFLKNKMQEPLPSLK